MKNKPLVYTVFVLAASLLVAIFYQTPLAYGHSGDVLSAWASVTPTIDGVLSAGEWDDAAMQTFTTTGEIQGILYVKNDANNIYLAVRITDSTLSQDTTINDKVWLYFDNDHDGLGPEVGDDIIGWIGYLSEGFRDGYSDGTYVWWRDTDDGGTSDGLAAATGDETYNYFEISHPLDTTDNTHDFSLSLEDTVGFAIRLTIDGYDKGWWPSDNVSEWADIVVASAVLAKPIPDIKANGFDVPITLGTDDALSVTVSLNPGEYEGENADWWLAAVTPFGIYFLTFDGWTTDWVSAYQGPLFSLDSFVLFNTSPLSGFPAGTYILYFGVDTNMDEKITWESLYYDYAAVNVLEYTEAQILEPQPRGAPDPSFPRNPIKRRKQWDQMFSIRHAGDYEISPGQEFDFQIELENPSMIFVKVYTYGDEPEKLSARLYQEGRDEPHWAAEVMMLRGSIGLITGQVEITADMITAGTTWTINLLNSATQSVSAEVLIGTVDLRMFEAE